MIDVTTMSFTYPGAKTAAVSDVTFSVQPGEIFGFLGPSGAGKSTTQKIIIGILKQYSGSVQLLGKEIKKINPDIYEDIGVAFEFPNFYTKFTALENLNYFKSLYKNRTADPMHLLEMVGLTKDAKKRVSSYSKGMKMRLNFCRTFLNNPRIIFLDEPTAGLDPVNARIVTNLIKIEKSKGTTIFLTTHNMSVADSLCDRVAFIIDGMISTIDSPQSLKLKYGKRVVSVTAGTDSKPISKEFDLDTIGTNREFQTFLKNNPIRTIHTQEATLEEIFIQITGKNLQ